MLNEALEQKWNEVFPPGRYRIEMALDTGIRIGQEERAFVVFEGMTFCWINAPSIQLCPVLVYCPADKKNIKPEFEIVMRFLSRLAFESGEAVCEFTTVGKSFGIGSMLQSHPRDTIGSLCVDPKYISESSPSSHALLLAYSFYKEGLNTKQVSVYYSFLSFYKVLQLAFGEGHAARIRLADWIDKNTENVCQHNDLDGIKNRAKEEGSLGSYLYSSCRCAIAHTDFTQKTVVNPDGVSPQ